MLKASKKKDNNILIKMLQLIIDPEVHRVYVMCEMLYKYYIACTVGKV